MGTINAGLRFIIHDRQTHVSSHILSKLTPNTTYNPPFKKTAMVAISTSILYSQLRQSIGSLTASSATLYDRIQEKLVTYAPQHREHILYPRFTTKDGRVILSRATAAFFTTKSVHSTSHQEPQQDDLDISNSSCNGLDMPVTPGYIAPRAPIVLCHGLYGYDKIGPDAIPSLQIHYWSGIDDALAKLGAKVIVTRVPRTAGISTRAQELHTILTATAKDTDINFLAHSMVSFKLIVLSFESCQA